MSEHARLSPSACERWFHCPGSVRLSDNFPEETSEFAKEGTAMHMVREKALLSGVEVSQYIGETVESDGSTFEVTPEWADWLQPGIDFLREQGGELFVEERVFLDAWMEGQFGTVDSLVIRDDLIIVSDFKGGRGVVVDAERNMQMMLYAIGAWDCIARHKTKATDFLLVIDQPRVPGGGSQWRTTLDELLRFAEEAAAAAKLTEDPDAPLKVTIKGCQFCRVASNAACPELHKFCTELVGLDPTETSIKEVPELPSIDQLTPERRSYVVQHAGLVKKWLGSIHEFHLGQAILGKPTPGFKAVATLGDRAWKDPAAAEEYWKAKLPAKDLYTQKMKSPTQLERVAGTRNWAKAQDLIHRPDGPPALVPESDKREALIPLIDLLEDLGDELDDLLGTADLDDLI